MPSPKLARKQPKIGFCVGITLELRWEIRWNYAEFLDVFPVPGRAEILDPNPAICPTYWRNSHKGSWNSRFWAFAGFSRLHRWLYGHTHRKFGKWA